MSKSPFALSVFGGAVALAVVVAALAGWGVTEAAVEGRRASVERRVRDAAELLLLVGAEHWDEGAAGLQAVAERVAGSLGGVRATFVAADGRVLADSAGDPARMDDHGLRAEILEPGTVVERFSRTTRRRMLYCALRVETGGRHVGFARAAIDADDLAAEVAAIRAAALRAGLVAALVGVLGAWLVARRVSRRLRPISNMVAAVGRGEYDRRLPADRRDEIGELCGALNEMAGQLRERVDRITSALREEEAMLGAMDEGVVAVGRDERVVLINQAARRLLQVEEDEPVGRPIWELTRIAPIVECVTTCLRDGTRVRSQVTLAGASDEQALQVNATPLGDDYGGNWGCVVVVYDLTEKYRLGRVRKDFVANASHELKTPLTAMRGYLEALIESPDMEADRRAEFLSKVGRNTRRLEEIVHELIDLARAESEGASLHMVPADALEILRDCVGVARETAAPRSVRIELDERCASAPVMADRRALETAFTNLLDNAIKFSPAGGTVAVEIWTEDREIWVEVHDEGPGIPRHEQERIFERFYRVEKGRDREVGGTGLGLAIVRHIVMAHGGEVAVDSAPGSGATFRVCLRRRRAA